MHAAEVVADTDDRRQVVGQRINLFYFSEDIISQSAYLADGVRVREFAATVTALADTVFDANAVVANLSLAAAQVAVLAAAASRAGAVAVNAESSITFSRSTSIVRRASSTTTLSCWRKNSQR